MESDRRSRLPALLAALLLAAAPGVRAAVPVWVEVPEVSWERLVPYLESHVVPELRGRQFQVFVCVDRVREDRVQPYDRRLGDFAKVLLWDATSGDRKVEGALLGASDAFRAELPGLTDEEREAYADRFWEQLGQSDDFLPRIQKRFDKARRKGRLRCRLCEVDPGFRPEGRID